LIFIQAGDNRGFAAGNNIGIKYALAKDDFEYIWLLNNDTVIEKNTLSKACMRLQNADNQKSKIGIVGSKLLFYDNPDIIQGIGGLYNKKLSTAKHLGAYEKDNGQFDTDKVLDTTNRLRVCTTASASDGFTAPPAPGRLTFPSMCTQRTPVTLLTGNLRFS
jgi:hypothetical protein